jgi:hypothetical protein
MTRRRQIGQQAEGDGVFRRLPGAVAGLSDAEWRAAGHSGPAMAVCPLDDDLELCAAGIRTTTSAAQLALWHNTRPVTMNAPLAWVGLSR